MRAVVQVARKFDRINFHIFGPLKNHFSTEEFERLPTLIPQNVHVVNHVVSDSQYAHVKSPNWYGIFVFLLIVCYATIQRKKEIIPEKFVTFPLTPTAKFPEERFSALAILSVVERTWQKI